MVPIKAVHYSTGIVTMVELILFMAKQVTSGLPQLPSVASATSFPLIIT